MAKYRVEFENKNLKSVEPATQDHSQQENITEEHTGDTIYALIDAENDAEANEKAKRLEIELQTGKTKHQITRNENEKRNPIE